MFYCSRAFASLNSHDRWPSKTLCLFLEIGHLFETNTLQFSVPLMLQHGTDDKITPIEMIRRWTEERVKANPLTFKEWLGHYHEIHNDLDREEVFNHLLDLIKKH